MRNVLIPKPRDDSLLRQYGAFVRATKGLGDEAVNFDMSELTWVCPSLILPLSIYILSTASTFSGVREEIQGYLSAINFPNGLDNAGEYYKQRTYIPLGILSSGSNGWDDLSAAFQEKVFQALAQIPGTKDAIYYPIAELIINISEHSQASFAGILAQRYPKKNYLDLCIVDNGRGFRQTYKEELGHDFKDHDAIRSALSGISTKKIDGRGFGLRTSKEMICEGLGGSVYIGSGRSAFISGATRADDFFMNINDYNWTGVMIMYRIPAPSGPIDYVKYIE